MKKCLSWRTLALMLILGCFLGCGGDDFRGNDGSIATSELDNEDQIPTITIEKIKTEKLERGEKVWWRLKADPAPKTDLAVWVKGILSEWVIVPKSKNNSEVFNTTFHFSKEISIESLPIVSVVGKGLVVDLELLQKGLPYESLGGHRIPKDFDFPVYSVGDPSHILVEVIPPVNLTSAIPRGGQIAPNATIVAIFDESPADVTVSAGTVTVTGRQVTIKGPFAPGPLNLTIVWTDGRVTLSYNVVAPDILAPFVIDGTIKDGDRDVDPEKINDDAVIEVTFSEEVAGHIALQTEGGADVGWISKVEGNKAMLELVKGKEIGNKTTYVIRGRVSDAAGNSTDVSITFVTKAKE